MVRSAARRAKRAGCEWLHVDFDDEELQAFFIETCGFAPTNAGLIHLLTLEEDHGRCVWAAEFQPPR